MGLISMMVVFFAAVFFRGGEGNAATLVKEDLKGVEEKPIYLRQFEIQGHTYIYFLETGKHGLKQIMHDPGCECQKKEKEKEEAK